MISLERFCSVFDVQDSAIDYITSAQTTDLANIRLLDYMMVLIVPKVKDSIFTFCNKLEAIIGSTSSKKSVVEELQKGTSIITMHVYDHLQGCHIQLMMMF